MIDPQNMTARNYREVGEAAIVYALRQVWTEEQIQNGLATYRGDLRAEHAEEIRAYARQMNDPHGPYRTAVKMADLFAEHITRPVEKVRCAGCIGCGGPDCIERPEANGGAA